MDTTRRQLLAAIPAVGIASVVGEGQEPAPQSTWEYYTMAFSAWFFEDAKELPLPGKLAEYGVKGYSVATALPGSPLIEPGKVQPPHERVVVIFKRPVDEKKRVEWEFKTFKDDGRGPYQRYRDLGAEGWEIFYATPFDGVSKIVQAQRPVRKGA